MEKIKKNITLIITVLSSFTILFMIIYMLTPLSTSYIRFLMVLQFGFDFYFVSRMFYKLRTYRKNELYFVIPSVLLCFLVSIFNMFYVFGFFSMNRFFLREEFFAKLLTEHYHILFLVYITKIIYLFYTFAKDKRSSFADLILSRFAIIFSLLLAIIFIILGIVFNNTFAIKYMPTFRQIENEVLYEANSRFFSNYEDVIEEIDYQNFAENYDLMIFYYDDELKYKSKFYDEFNKVNMLFEMTIIQGDGFFFVRSGKFFMINFYLFVLLYIIALVFTLSPVIILARVFINNKFTVFIDAMIKGFEDDNYNQIVDIDKMEDTEIKKLVLMFNNKYLAYKYREKYMKIDIR